MRRYSKIERHTSPALRQFPENLQANKLAVMRSAHTTSDKVFPLTRAYVVGNGHCWTPGSPLPKDAQPSALDALRRHAEVAEAFEREQERRTRRAA